MIHPIQSIQWLPVGVLYSNDWNPNVVISPEMKLLKLSLIKQGWVQPVLVSREQNEHGDDIYIIIDGFHRTTLVRSDDEVRALTDGQVPCAVLELSVPERMLLTVRINRAKGSHVSIKMHELVRTVVETYGMALKDVATEIGATVHEVETLLMENVFKKLGTEGHAYSQAWEPR